MITRIDHGQVWTGERLEEVSLLVRDEQIEGFCSPEQASEHPAGQVIDAQGQWVLPGGVDLHVHISDGSETFTPGSACATAGGVTTVMDMAPFHACVTPDQFRRKVEAAESACLTDFGLIAGIVIQAEDLKNLKALHQVGAASFKVFMPAPQPVSAEVLWQAVQAAARTGLRMALHAEEEGCCETPRWKTGPLAFPQSRPAVAETSATAQVLEMARAAGAPLQICHVSAARTADLIADAKAAGVDVTAEVAPHYLVLDESAFAVQGPRVKTTPPLRTAADAAHLWEALADGTLDVIASDHYIEDLSSVSRDTALIETAAAGIAGLELSLPLVYAYGVCSGKLTFKRWIEAASTRPAQIARIAHRKGALAAGMDADFFLFDPRQEWTVCTQGEFSRATTTPFEGLTLPGRITQTWVRGSQVWDGTSIIQSAGFGRWIPSRS